MRVSMHVSMYAFFYFQFQFQCARLGASNFVYAWKSMSVCWFVRVSTGKKPVWSACLSPAFNKMYQLSIGKSSSCDTINQRDNAYDRRHRLRNTNNTHRAAMYGFILSNQRAIKRLSCPEGYRTAQGRNTQQIVISAFG